MSAIWHTSPMDQPADPDPMKKNRWPLFCLLLASAGCVAADPGIVPAARPRAAVAGAAVNAGAPAVSVSGVGERGKMRGSTRSATRYGMGYERRMRMQGSRGAGQGRGGR